MAGRQLVEQQFELNPNLMLPENQPQVREIRTLTSNMLETQATNADRVTTINSYTCVE